LIIIIRKTVWGRVHQAFVTNTGLPDVNIHPQFSNAKCIEVGMLLLLHMNQWFMTSLDVNEGEILFIPKLWWHHVVAEEPRFSMIIISSQSN
jgi:hypothetical protein